MRLHAAAPLVLLVACRTDADESLAHSCANISGACSCDLGGGAALHWDCAGAPPAVVAELAWAGGRDAVLVDERCGFEAELAPWLARRADVDAARVAAALGAARAGAARDNGEATPRWCTAFADTWLATRARDVRALDFGDARAPSLNVGCGPLFQVQEEGCRGMWDPGEWVHLDADPRALPNADREYVAWQSKCPDGSTVTTRTLRHDVTTGLSMIANASLASIFAEHVAEHLPPETVPRVLAEFWRVLRPGGTLRLSTPDLRKFAAAYLGRSDTELDFVARAHRWAPRHPSWEAPEYSGAAIVNDLFRNHGHDVGFIWDAPSLTRAMVRAGIPSDAIAEDAYQSGKPLSEFDSPLRRAESFYLAATKPLTPGDDRALAEPADPEDLADAGADAFELAVGAAFKWDRGAPQWAAAFLASNDALPHYDGVCATIGALAALPGVGVELATVVGGLGFLPLLECADNWRRVTLVDGNVNEFGKVLAFRRGLRTRRTRAAYAAAPVDRELEAALAADPAAFYLPGALARGGVRLERASPHRRFAFAYDGREAPLTSLLPPSAYPELAWRARTDRGYRNVRRALIQALHRTLYLRPPAAGELDAAGRACVVFASMPDTEGLERALAAATRDCAVVLPVRACGKGTGSWCDGAAPHNLALLDPHPLWRVAARAAVGRAATVLHYWSPEDRLALGGPHDADWEVNAAADGGATSHPDPEPALRRVDAALLHMLFGKRTACDDGDRARLFSRVVSNLPALCPRLERVVVSEFVAGALAPTNPARACLPSPDDLADLVLAALPGFEHAETSYAPGGGAARRSVLVSFARRGIRD